MVSKDTQRYMKEVVFVEDAIDSFNKVRNKMEKYYVKVQKQLEQPLQ